MPKQIDDEKYWEIHHVRRNKRCMVTIWRTWDLRVQDGAGMKAMIKYMKDWLPNKNQSRMIAFIMAKRKRKTFQTIDAAIVWQGRRRKNGKD